MSTTKKNRKHSMNRDKGSESDDFDICGMSERDQLKPNKFRHRSDKRQNNPRNMWKDMEDE